MKSKKTTTTVEKQTSEKSTISLFGQENKLWMLAGIAIMIIGFLLMAGGRSEDPNVFNANEVYSTTRITIAPILLLAGLVILIFSIFREPKQR
jgi:predicted ABC-type sugar transport system permease subunit